MACAPQAIMLSANNRLFFFNNNNRSRYPPKDPNKSKGSPHFFRICASSDETDCNVEECAPEKEVGKVSMEWLAGEKTQVVGTYPPRGWTGYVEKDTAGQKNIYSIEPTVYVAESAISSGTAGSSADGTENTAAIVAGIALITLAAASSLLLQVGKNPPPQTQAVEYSGPSLSYYVNKFKPPEQVEVPVAAEPETASPFSSETTVQDESVYRAEEASPPTSGVSSDIKT